MAEDGLPESAEAGKQEWLDTDAVMEEALKLFGMERAQHFGWQDTYVYTKVCWVVFYLFHGYSGVVVWGVGWGGVDVYVW